MSEEYCLSCLLCLAFVHRCFINITRKQQAPTFFPNIHISAPVKYPTSVSRHIRLKVTVKEASPEVKSYRRGVISTSACLFRKFRVRRRRAGVHSSLVGGRTGSSVVRARDRSRLVCVSVSVGVVGLPFQIGAALKNVKHSGLVVCAWRVLGDDVPRVNQARQVSEEAQDNVDQGLGGADSAADPHGQGRK